MQNCSHTALDVASALKIVLRVPASTREAGGGDSARGGHASASHSWRHCLVSWACPFITPFILSCVRAHLHLSPSASHGSHSCPPCHAPPTCTTTVCHSHMRWVVLLIHGSSFVLLLFISSSSDVPAGFCSYPYVCLALQGTPLGRACRANHPHRAGCSPHMHRLYLLLHQAICADAAGVPATLGPVGRQPSYTCCHPSCIHMLQYSTKWTRGRLSACTTLRYYTGQ